MLTDQELDNVFNWQPYRNDWPVDRNKIAPDDNIILHYGDLIKSLTENASFNTYYTEDGGLANYLEFMCYPNGYETYEGNAIIVCVSLCCPIAVYGQIKITKGIDFFGWGNLFSPENIGIINDLSLLGMETVIKNILAKQRLEILDKDLAARPLPDTVLKSPLYENHNHGNQYLHGIFQKTD
jgi:hypothetical protein